MSMPLAETAVAPAKSQESYADWEAINITSCAPDLNLNMIFCTYATSVFTRASNLVSMFHATVMILFMFRTLGNEPVLKSKNLRL